jgi:hypothetical protein
VVFSYAYGKFNPEGKVGRPSFVANVKFAEGRKLFIFLVMCYRLGTRFLPQGGFDRLNHRIGRRLVAERWFRQAQPPHRAAPRYRKVVSTGSTTALGGASLPKGGFDRLNHRAGRRLVAERWFRQAQPPQRAAPRYRKVVSTGSTTALGGASLPKGGFDRLNHRSHPITLPH